MIEEQISAHLIAGERIIWSGQPAQGLLFTPRDALLIPFSLFWCGFAVFWTVMATGDGAPGFFTLWGLMFVSVGLFMAVGRFAFDAWVRSGMRYAITDRRVLILRSAPFGNFTAVNLAQLPNTQLSLRAGGRGTIRFGESPGMFTGRGMSWAPSLDPTPQFLAIDNAKRVFDMVQRSDVSRPDPR